MPTVDVYSLNRDKVGSLELNPEVFDVEVREHLFHAVVTAQLAARRSGTASAKERNAISGTRQKKWRQKGTGRARQGDGKAVHFVGGGVVHGPRPRSFEKKVNKRTRVAALCAALSRRQQEGRLVVLDAFEVAEIKTKSVASALSKWDGTRTLIIDGDNENLAKSAKNLADASYLSTDGLNVYDILLHDTVMVTKAAVEAIEGRLGK